MSTTVMKAPSGVTGQVTSDADITWSGGNLTVADGSTYNTVAGQVVNWIASGY